MGREHGRGVQDPSLHAWDVNSQVCFAWGACLGKVDTEIGGLGEQMAPRPLCGALPARRRPDRRPWPGAAPSAPCGLRVA